MKRSNCAPRRLEGHSDAVIHLLL